MRLGLLVAGAALLAVGASLSVVTWIAVDRCDALSARGCGTPGGTTCESYAACPVLGLEVSLAIAGTGGILLAVGGLTKSRDEITAEALAQLPPAT